MWRLLVFIKRSFAISPHVFARAIHLFHALSNQRAQGKPDARCTRGLVCKLCKRKRTRAYRSSGGNPTFPAQWFYSLSRALPGDQTWDCHRHRRRPNRRLDASLEASGPHAFAVHFKCSRQSHHSRPPHPRPTSVTIANAPLSGTGFRKYRSDLGQAQANNSENRKIFFQQNRTG